MNKLSSSTERLGAAGHRGTRQSLRVAFFAAALLAFLVASYFAFFRSHFPPANAKRSGIFSGGWWLRPIEFNPAGRLDRVNPEVDFTCISALVGGGHIWIGGSQGLLLHSADDGQSWEQLPVVTASPIPLPVGPTPAPASGAGYRPRAEDEIIRVGMPEPTPTPRFSKLPVSAPNKSKQPDPTQQQTLPLREFTSEQKTLNELAPPNPQQTQAPAQSAPEKLPPLTYALLSNNIIDLQFVTESLGYAVTQPGEILTTNDGGRTWRLQRTADFSMGFAVRVRFADERRGVMLGSFGVASTNDGGESWSAPLAADSLVSDVVLLDGLNGLAVGLFPEIAHFLDSDSGPAPGEHFPIAGTTSASPQFIRIAKGGTQSIFACSNQGEVARSANGGEWQAFAVPNGGSLSSIFFVDDRVGWVGNQSGKIFVTRDRGETWQPQATGQAGPVRDLYFASAFRGFAVGGNATFLGTEDGGRTWQPLVTTDDSRRGRHAWLPPPWYFATLLLLFGLVRRIPDEIAPPPREGIGEILISDKPIGAEDRDYLGFREVAWGLSNYLRNKATRPPLTIAITGEWGMGKSSLMNLLNSDLVHYKFRPVWFNAWHHQTEEHLLAALLENIRTQAIPSVSTPEGMVFRAKLLWLRARRNLFATLLLVAAGSFALSYFFTGHYQLGESPEVLAKLLQSPGTIATRLARNSEAAKAIFALLSGIGSVIAFARGFRAFGVNPASLLASKSNAAKASDLRAQTSFRHKFACEFREVTESLDPLTMVVFVDDLDRCRPEQVYEMLEAINFLVSCGDCFVIMGLARRRVERCVGLVFEKIAAEAPDVVDGQTLTEGEKRQRFARQYLEKLINIEVPVPKGEPEQIRTLLISKSADAPVPSRWEMTGRKFNDWLPHLIPIVLCLIVAGIGIWASSQMFKPGALATKEATAVSSVAPAVPGPAVTPGLIPPPPDALPAPSMMPQIGAARFVSGQPGSAPFWIILLVGGAILVPGIIRLVAAERLCDRGFAGLYQRTGGVVSVSGQRRGDDAAERKAVCESRALSRDDGRLVPACAALVGTARAVPSAAPADCGNESAAEHGRGFARGPRHSARNASAMVYRQLRFFPKGFPNRSGCVAVSHRSRPRGRGNLRAFPATRRRGGGAVVLAFRAARRIGVRQP